MGVSRRVALAGAASLVGVAWGRKPRAQTGDLGELELHDPPRAVPDLRWTDGAGMDHRLGEFAGQGVILNFWATWCGPCVAEMPSLAALAGQVSGDRIVVLPVSADTGGAAAVRGFYAAHRIAGLGVWLDPKSVALQEVGAVGLPTTLILDRRGREVARVSGAADWTQAATVQTLRALCEV